MLKIHIAPLYPITVDQVDELAEYMKKNVYGFGYAAVDGKMRVALAGAKTQDQRKQVYKPILIGMCKADYR